MNHIGTIREKMHDKMDEKRGKRQKMLWAEKSSSAIIDLTKKANQAYSFI